MYSYCPDSNFSLQQSCSANLQACNKFNRNLPRQAIAKTEYEESLGFEPPTHTLPKSVVLTTQPVRLGEEKIDCANTSCIYDLF
ncbi:hypothetical protein AVEN_193239-1 [Araneus ventricosus]|uniref:Uncharacterized protein n=1 Tax=Araneus ventricosus TaxID=182803 RepID=A0A4Y2PUI8_ARAVE|nr:hypothetical protein AVEN_193239-1 [Araneus ventricosus]